MSNVTNMATTIMALKPSQVVRNELVKQQFINVYNAVWREGGEQAYEREAFYFQSILRDKPNLKDCTPLSFYFAFIDIAVQGISLEPGPRAMCYLLPRNFKIADPTGRDGKNAATSPSPASESSSCASVPGRLSMPTTR